MALNSDWRSSPKDAVAVMDLALGLKWSHLFLDDRYGIAIKAAYEYHLYFDQNRFFDSYSKNYLPPRNNYYVGGLGDLIYQGISGSIQFDF